MKIDGEYFNYNLKSWDGGKVWYAIEYDTDCVGGQWGITILGRADELYPGLLQHIENWDRLSKYVETHGAINPTDPEGLKVLEGVGATVEIDSLKTSFKNKVL